MESSGLLLIILGGLYFVPSLVAYFRRHLNKISIVLTNLFLGWTFLGWVAALIWATSDNCRPETTLPTEQIDQKMWENERFNWQPKVFFGVIALLVGLGIGGVGVWFMSAAWTTSNDAQDHNLLIGTVALAIGAMIIWGVIAPTVRGTFLFVLVRAAATLMSMGMAALGGALGIDANGTANPEVPILIYVGAGALIMLSLFFMWFGICPRPRAWRNGHDH